MKTRLVLLLSLFLGGCSTFDSMGQAYLNDPDYRREFHDAMDKPSYAAPATVAPQAQAPESRNCTVIKGYGKDSASYIYCR